MDEKGGIGKNNALPWHIHSDLQRFKKLTMHHHIIMGRKTYQTIGKPLPGRKMIIVTRSNSFFAKDCVVVPSIHKALSITDQNGENEAFIIGGGQIFSQTINIINRIYLTIVETDSHADIFFPKINFANWNEIYFEKIPKGEGDEFATQYKILERKT
jgi:dihydrofolate reductase